MKNVKEIKERFMSDALQRRLGGLAANLARVRSFSTNPANHSSVEGLINESKYFIEWTTLDVSPACQEELVQLQIRLSLWQREWREIWGSDSRRKKMASDAGNWSERVLKIAGLI